MRVADYFDRTASMFPEQEAFVDVALNRRLNYQYARDFAHQVAVVLTGKLGLTHGSKVAVYSPNDSLAYLAIVGVSRADMIWLPLNYRNALSTNAQLLSFFAADVLIYHSQFEDSIAELKALAPDIKHFLCLDADSSEGPSLSSLFSDAAVTYDTGPEDPMATAWMLATGGTTGPSKGVEHSHHSGFGKIRLQLIGSLFYRCGTHSAGALQGGRGEVRPLYYRTLWSDRNHVPSALQNHRRMSGRKRQLPRKRTACCRAGLPQLSGGNHG